MFPINPSIKNTGTGSTSHLCPNCGNSFSSRSSYQNHNCRPSSKKLCQQCHKNYIFTNLLQNSISAYSMPIQISILDDVTLYSYDICNFTFLRNKIFSNDFVCFNYSILRFRQISLVEKYNEI